MEEITSLLNTIDAEQGGDADKTALRQLQAQIHALHRHYQLAQGIIACYLDLPAPVNAPDIENRQREIDASAVAWLNSAVK